MSSPKRLDPGLSTPKNERMDIVRAFVRVHRFKVQDVTDHMKLIRNAITAMHVSRRTSDIKRFAAVVALQK
ncbi:protein of unknown function [Candidatus Filomicrobium marinum]|uniref:Uncharacterized protein n=1 Tax=Candidatus Filomicrobium marinum TaxID=1608628 RepID=A0A0D6JGY2_9HYPH|nr:protein of unknown function [Candidatus Filomicrobium marinum]CPR20645.1 protein of unknown function [Candidatus Filomicrobium marinum]